MSAFENTREHFEAERSAPPARERLLSEVPSVPTPVAAHAGAGAALARDGSGDTVRQDSPVEQAEVELDLSAALGNLPEDAVVFGPPGQAVNVHPLISEVLQACADPGRFTGRRFEVPHRVIDMLTLPPCQMAHPRPGDRVFVVVKRTAAATTFAFCDVRHVTVANMGVVGVDCGLQNVRLGYDGNGTWLSVTAMIMGVLHSMSVNFLSRRGVRPEQVGGVVIIPQVARLASAFALTLGAASQSLASFQHLDCAGGTKLEFAAQVGATIPPGHTGLLPASAGEAMAAAHPGAYWAMDMCVGMCVGELEVDLPVRIASRLDGGGTYLYRSWLGFEMVNDEPVLAHSAVDVLCAAVNSVYAARSTAEVLDFINGKADDIPMHDGALCHVLTRGITEPVAVIDDTARQTLRLCSEYHG